MMEIIDGNVPPPIIDVNEDGEEFFQDSEIYWSLDDKE